MATAINQAFLQGNWQQLKGKIKEQWGKLTDDDLLQSEGNTEKLIGRLTERYGYKKEEAQQKLSGYLNQFENKLNDSGNKADSMISNIAVMAGNVNEKTHELLDDCQNFTKKNPFTALGVVAAAGFLLGLFISKPVNHS